MEFSNNCTLYIYNARSDPISLQDICKRLEGSNEDVKVEAMQDLITAMIHGERMEKSIMHVIRFALPSPSKRVKRLTYLFFEVVDKCTPQGDLKEEMILVCNALRNDLICPNEYIRGCALRLVATIKQWKIVEPLLEAVMKNLGHRHSYVRKNAVMCIFALYKTFGAEALPCAAEAVDKLLLLEGDASTRRGAFLMLLHTDVERAVAYVQSQIHHSPEIALAAALAMGDLFLLALLKLFTIVCRNHHPIEDDLFALILVLLPSAPPSVAYQGACAILSVSKSVEAVRAACGAFVSLLRISTDTNIILVLLDRIKECIYTPKYLPILSEFVVDILRGLHTSSMEVRRSALSLCLCLCCPDTVSRILMTFKREIATLNDSNDSLSCSNKRTLVDAMYTCCVRFPNAAVEVMNSFGDLLSDRDAPCSLKSALLFRALSISEPQMREQILNQILDALPDILHGRTMRVCLWIAGEFCSREEETTMFLESIYKLMSPFPLLPNTCNNDEESAIQTSGTAKVQTRTVILDDGTYGTQDIVPSSTDPNQTEMSFLRRFITQGDGLLACVLATTITKLLLRSSPAYISMRDKIPEQGSLGAFTKPSNAQKQQMMQCVDIPLLQKNQMLLVTASLLKLVRFQCGVSGDAYIRINQCLRCVCDLLKSNSDYSITKTAWFLAPTATTTRVESAGDIELTMPSTINHQKRQIEPASIVNFRHLGDGLDSSQNVGNIPAFDAEDAFYNIEHHALNEFDDHSDADLDEIDIALALDDSHACKNDREIFFQRLEDIHAITSLSDPIYAEVFLRIAHFDVIAEILLVNRTSEPLFNICIELCCHGDLQIVDRPASLTLQPGEHRYLYYTVKVKSIEAGIIYGYILFSSKACGMQQHYLILSEISINPLMFIHPTYINNNAFQTKWSEFEWENKLYVNSSISDIGVYLGHLLRYTHMTIVGDSESNSLELDGSDHFDYSINSFESLFCVKRPAIQALRNLEHHAFFSVNLYSRSVFGEDALANVSLEKISPSHLAGSIRIRSRTQGVALSVGDRISLLQRKLTPVF